MPLIFSLITYCVRPYYTEQTDESCIRTALFPAARCQLLNMSLRSFRFQEMIPATGSNERHRYKHLIKCFLVMKARRKSLGVAC